MKDEDLKEIVLSALRDIAPEADVAHIDPDTEFHDQLDFDSIDFLNFGAALSDKLRIDIPESECPRLGTLRSCLEYLQQRLGA